MARRDSSRVGTRSPILPQLATELTTARAQYGVRAMLVQLNARTRYRFTGIYRVEPPLLRNVYLVDRENPSIDGSGGVEPLGDTHAAIAIATGRPFATDGQRDAERSSPVRCYLGVPIRGADGRVCGTLCHFDARPRLVMDSEIAVLEWVAATLADCVR